MDMWAILIDLLRAGLFAATHVCGGNLGLGIVTLSLVVRFALLPLTYAVARQSQTRAIRLAKLQPQLDRLRQRYREDPVRLARENARLLRRHKVGQLAGMGLLGTLIQLPFVAGMYTVVRGAVTSGVGGRFLWIQNISRPDALLALLAAALVYGVALLSPQVTQQAPRWQMLLPAVVTLVFLVKLSAGLGLYWGTSSAVGCVQALLLRRRLRGAAI
jgi:YidC/Oxa1 family membrane protein insertase